MIIVDTKEIEPNREFWITLWNKMGIEATELSLETGDMRLTSANLGVERKTLSDFQSSLFSKRLISQLMRMLSEYEYPILLLEYQECLFDVESGYIETWRGNKKVRTSLKLSTLHNFLHKIQKAGMEVMHSQNRLETGLLMGHLHEYYKSEHDDLFNKRSRDLNDRKVTVLCQVEGIQQKTAKKILKQYDYNLSAVFLDTTENLMQIEGIGYNTVQKIKNFWGMPKNTEEPIK